MLTKLSIDNIRCLNHFELAPGEFNLWLGENGSGKSTAIEVLQALRDAIAERHPIDEPFDGASRCAWRKMEPMHVRLQVELVHGTYVYDLSTDLDDRGRAVVASERLVLDGQPLITSVDGSLKVHVGAPQSILTDVDQSALSVLGRDQQAPELQAFLQWVASIQMLRLSPLDIDSGAKAPVDHLDMEA